ncbi:MAG: amidase family protein [Gemmatimonadota bacterium]|nr:amidase family protein [Gemmatimonadota bacterium]
MGILGALCIRKRRVLPQLMIFFAAAGLSRAAHAQSPEPPFDVYEVGVPELQAAMAGGTVTSVQLVELYLARIQAFDEAGPRLNAILQLNPLALQEAAALDEERARQGPRGPLHGIPVLLKDNFDVTGMPTTAGSIALLDMVPPDDSWLAGRLREGGAVLLGKTNMQEFALGITTESSVGGQTRNPYDLTRNPGGSSGGTAVSVAASFAALGWGTDTCGSVRIPAAYNSLFGLRPTKGLISTDGMLPLSHSLDTPGPMARTAMDLAIAMDAVLTPSPAEGSTGAPGGVAPHFVEGLDGGAFDGIRIGVLGDHLDGTWTVGEILAELGRHLPSSGSLGREELESVTLGSAIEGLEVGQTARRALERMEKWGAELITVEIEEIEGLLAGHEVIDLEFELDVRAYLEGTPKARVHSLSEILALDLHNSSSNEMLVQRSNPGSPDSGEYRDALARLRAARDRLVEVFERERLDALAYPTMRRPPAEIGQPQWGSTCLLSSSTGLPAITIPVGLGPGGLPVGLELLGRPMDDARLVAFAHAYEKAMRPRMVPPTTPPLNRRSTAGQGLERS